MKERNIYSLDILSSHTTILLGAFQDTVGQFHLKNVFHHKQSTLRSDSTRVFLTKLNSRHRSCSPEINLAEKPSIYNCNLTVPRFIPPTAVHRKGRQFSDKAIIWQMKIRGGALVECKSKAISDGRARRGEKWKWGAGGAVKNDFSLQQFCVLIRFSYLLLPRVVLFSVCAAL